MHLVILDDQPGLAEMLALSLRSLGYSAAGFIHPEEALAALKENDVLVTDYQMPEMTGLEVARKAYDAGWRGSLLIMSGNCDVLNGNIDHPLLRMIIGKPLSISDLVRALEGASSDVVETKKSDPFPSVP